MQKLALFNEFCTTSFASALKCLTQWVPKNTTETEEEPKVNIKDTEMRKYDTIQNEEEEEEFDQWPSAPQNNNAQQQIPKGDGFKSQETSGSRKESNIASDGYHGSSVMIGAVDEDKIPKAKQPEIDKNALEEFTKLKFNNITLKKGVAPKPAEPETKQNELTSSHQFG